jgi:hypothetical protein
MNHLLVGKKALVSGSNKSIDPTTTRIKIAPQHSSPKSQNRKEHQQQQDITIHWKDMKNSRVERRVSNCK